MACARRTASACPAVSRVSPGTEMVVPSALAANAMSAASEPGRSAGVMPAPSSDRSAAPSPDTSRTEAATRPKGTANNCAGRASARVTIRIGPAGAATPACARNSRATMVSAIGAGTAWQPSSAKSAPESAQAIPAPPASSGTSRSRKPDCSISSQTGRQSVLPVSMPRTVSGGKVRPRRRSKASLISFIIPLLNAARGRAR